MSSPIPQRTRMNRLPTDRVEQVSVVETRLQDLNIEHADLLHRLEEIALLRAKLLRERNDLCVPTHILPAEVLSRIFMMVSSPIRLSAVCAYWREVAEGAPLLWRSIICRMSRKDIQGDTKNYVHRLRLFLKNSGLVKVSLHLHVDGWKMSNNGHAVREILTIITQEANDQIQTLRLRSSAPWDRRVTETVYFHVYPAHFPSLLVLDIGSELDHPRHRLNAPHLRKLILTDAPSAKWSFNQKFWDHLTAIRIDRTVVSTCLTLLRSCPSHLESFRCINPTISLSGHTFRLPLKIPSRLAQFEWTGGLGSLDEYFWQNVKLPVVRDLTWNLLEPLKESQTQIRREFFRQLSNVQKMKMEFYSGINELRDVWRSLDKLQELHLDACRLQKQGGPDIMDALTLCHDCGHQNVLPNLRVLEIEILIGSSSTITRMLRSRRDSPLLREGQMALGFDVDQGPIRLERSVLHMEQLDWEQGDREKLNVLVAAGLLLDIYVGDDHLSSF